MTLTMDPVLHKAFESSTKGQSFAFATIIQNTSQGTPRKCGSKMVVHKDGSTFGSIGGGTNEKKVIVACKKAIKDLKPHLLTFKNFGKKGQSICGGKFTVFIEPFSGSKTLIICGGGHIALSLSYLAKMLNFRLIIIDNRKTYANKKRFPHADQILNGSYVKILKNIPIHRDSYVVIMTHEHKFDWQCLKCVLHKNAQYISVISSRTKKEIFFKKLKKENFPKDNIKKLKMPAGLDIGSQTPEEIAISIAAQIIADYNKNFLHTAKFKK